ncbi:MAG: DUF2752 domain-containing protein [Clostridia bacterium]|nr:DUF2752 domain-containing protein [Clostridia bacterium]
MIKKNLEAWTFLIGSIGIILLSFLLNYQDNMVTLKIFNIELGNIYRCPVLYFFHIPCPTCGLSRAFILFAHFQFAEAIRYNMAVTVLFPYLLLQIPLQLIDIIRKQRGLETSRLRKINVRILIVIGVILIVIWILKLFQILPNL